MHLPVNEACYNTPNPWCCSNDNAKLPAPRAGTSACVLELFGAEQDQEFLLSLLPIHPLLFKPRGFFAPSCALHVGNVLILFHFNFPGWQWGGLNSSGWGEIKK